MTPPPALDHLIHLYPSVASLQEAITFYSSLGFLVYRGGNQADALTTNALIVLTDGIYLELIAFLGYEDVDRGGETREEWERRKGGHWWSQKKPGWIDWCLAGGVQDGRVATINSHTTQAAYKEPREGGRTTLRGEEIKWKVTFPVADLTPLALPFWCEDVTPREVRVPPLPTSSSSSSPHPNKVQGISALIFLFAEEHFHQVIRAWELVLPRKGGGGDEENQGMAGGKGGQEEEEEEGIVTFFLSSPVHSTKNTSTTAPIQVIAKKAHDSEERHWLSSHVIGSGEGAEGKTLTGLATGGLYEVRFLSPIENLPASATTDEIERQTQEAGYGRIRFHSLS